MINKFQRILSGTLALIFISQVLIYGNGNSQGVAHAETINDIKSYIQTEKRKDKLADAFKKAGKGIGEIDYFDTLYSPNITSVNAEESDDEIEYSSELTIFGSVKKGTVTGYTASYDTPIYVYIYDEDWNPLDVHMIFDGGYYFVSAELGYGANFKIECDGYLPFYLKDFGTGAYEVGSGESKDTVTLIPGDTTYNEWEDNAWSDDVLDENDGAYVESCLGAYRGDSNFNITFDMDGDGHINQEEYDYYFDYYSNFSDEMIEATAASFCDVNGDGVINYNDMRNLINYYNDLAEAPASVPDFNGNGILDEKDIDLFMEYISTEEVMWFNLDLNNNGYVEASDIDLYNDFVYLRDRSENYFEYMDKNDDGTIANYDVNWFKKAYEDNGIQESDRAYKKSIIMYESGKFNGSLNLHDTNLDLNGCALYVGDCMSFTTDIPEFWSGGEGAYLDINGGYLEVYNNLVFRTASPDGWGGNAGQTMNLNGGMVKINNCFDFGQANCYDTILMTNSDDFLAVGGNWTYITLTDMEGKWTAGQILFTGPVWEVNEASGDKSIYSSGTQSIIFGYAEGKQTILWDNCETYINNEDGSLNTERTFNFDYEDGLLFLYEFTEENYWFRPWWRPYDEPDYTLYRNGYEMGDGVHLATGNYTKSFTDLSIESPGVQADFVRTYNSMGNEEGSFGIGWDFNIDVSKIIIPAQGYYQVVLPDGSNTTFKDDGNGGYECLNAHSTMKKSGNTYTITNAAQSQYYFNADGELEWVKNADGNQLTISSMTNNQRIVTDSTGRTYTITYNGNTEHSRITKIEDNTADRVVTYKYNSDFQLISATSVSGGTESYAYDGNGRLCKITNCYGELTEQIVYHDNGSVNWLTNASGLKQVYTYDKAYKKTGLKEYDGTALVKTYTYDYDEKYAVKTNTIQTDGQTYEMDKITYNLFDGKNKYNEISESIDIMGNKTKYYYDSNGNVTKTTNPDGTYTLANYNNKNSLVAAVDEMGNATIKVYDSNGTRLLKQATSLHPLTKTDIHTVTAANFDPVRYLEANESSYAITVLEYFADSYVSGVAGLIRATTDPEGNVTEFDYYTNGIGKGLVKTQTLKNGNTIVNTVTYEYNAQLQVSKESTSYDLSKNLYSVNEYEYDKFNNVTVTKEYGIGSTPAITIAEYDLLSRKTAEYSPKYSADKSHGTRISYYADDNQKTETNAEGNTTSYEYNAYGQVTKKTNPDGTMNLSEYDGMQREKAAYFMASDIGIKQILSETSYEFVEYAFDIYNGLDSSVSHSYKGQKISNKFYITEEKQVLSETLTDYKQRVIYEKTNGETKRTSAYYTNGQLARQTDALGNTTKFEYGFLNQVTKTHIPISTKADGSVRYSITENRYDKNGNTIETKQTVQKEDSDTAKYSVTKNKYNAQNLLVEVTLSDGSSHGEKNITKYFYNNGGIQTKMYTGLHSESDTNYMTTHYEYDAWGQLVRTTDSTGYVSGNTAYDLNGNVVTVSDANGNVITNTYDALNRVLTETTVSNDTSKNISKSFTYDIMGRVKSKVNNGVSTSYEYDSLGRLTKELGETFKGYFYVGVSKNIENHIIGINHMLLYSNTSYEYDNEMRMIKVKESGNETASYTYDANGNKATETLANGVVSAYTYNACNWLTNLLTKSGDSTISDYDYSYYLDGSYACKVRKENGIIETTSYDYDGLKRLTKESISNGTSADSYAYEYDDYGNRSKMTASGSEAYETVYDYNNADGNYTSLLQKEIKTVEVESKSTRTDGFESNPPDVLNPTLNETTAEEITYTYDGNGNQITKATAEKTETNTFDGLNQLIGFTDGESTASYTYDVDGLRLSKTVNGETTNHVWDGNKQIIADVKQGEFYNADCYLRGTNLLAKYNFFNAAKSEYTYYIQNAHGDVVNLTDANGAVTKSYNYDAFGVEKNIDDSDTNAFRYCGEYYDSESGTIYLRARYYNPSIGRFISRDSYAGESENPLSLNLYTYCFNNPNIYADSSGNNPVVIIAGIVLTAADIAIMALLLIMLAYSLTPAGQDAIMQSATAVGDVFGDIGDAVQDGLDSAKSWAKKNKKSIIKAGIGIAASAAKSAVRTKTKQKKDTKYYIYVLTDKKNVVQYVGQTIDPDRRKAQHQKSASRGHLEFNKVDGMVFDTKLEARMAEQAGIEYFNTLNKVSNSNQTSENPKLRQNNQRNEIAKYTITYLKYKMKKPDLTSQFEAFSRKSGFKLRE